MNETNDDTNDITDSTSNTNNETINSELISSSTSDAYSFYDTKTNRNSGLNVKMPNSSSFSIPNFNSCDSSDLLISHYISLQVVIVLKF